MKAVIDSESQNDALSQKVSALIKSSRDQTEEAKMQEQINQLSRENASLRNENQQLKAKEADSVEEALGISRAALYLLPKCTRPRFSRIHSTHWTE